MDRRADSGRVAGLRAAAYQALGAAALGGTLAWHSRDPLLAWVAAPLIRYVRSTPCGKRGWLWLRANSSSPSSSFIVLASTAAFLAALPLLMRFVWTFVAERSSSPRRWFGIAPIVASYVAVAFGLYAARRFLWPAVIDRMFGGQDWCGEGLRSSLVQLLNDYVAHAAAASIGAVLVLELVVGGTVVLAARRSERRGK